MIIALTSHKRIKPKKNAFTLMELIAVIVITSILIAICLRIMKTDSAKANAQTFGSFLTYCQAQAMAYGPTGSNGKTVYHVVKFTVTGTSPNLVTTTVTLYRETQSSAGAAISSTSTDKVKEESFMAGSRTLLSDGNDITGSAGAYPLIIYYNSLGEPVNSTGTSQTAGYSLYFRMKTSTATGIDGAIPVIVKPFTGKVTYYTP